MFIKITLALFLIWPLVWYCLTLFCSFQEKHWYKLLTRESCIVTAVERLVSAHAEFCPWAASPNPIDWTRWEGSLYRADFKADRAWQYNTHTDYIRQTEAWHQLIQGDFSGGTLKGWEGSLGNFLCFDLILTFKHCTMFC